MYISFSRDRLEYWSLVDEYSCLRIFILKANVSAFDLENTGMKLLTIRSICPLGK